MKLLPRASSNSFVGNSALIFLSRFFPTLASVAVGIYFSHTLDTEVYGTYVNFWTRLFLISTFACLGLQSFLITYTPAVVASLIKNLTAKHYSLIALWILITAGIFTYLQYSGGDYLLPFMFLIIYVVSIIIETVLMVFRNLGTLIWVNLMHAIAFCYVHYLFVSQSFSINTLFWYLLCLAAVKLLIYAIVFVKDLSGYNDVSSVDIKQIRSLWLHMGVYDVSQVVFKWIDKVVIGWLFTASVSAVYFNGSNDVPFLPLLMGAVGSAALMQLSMDKSVDAPLVVMNKSGRILSSLVFPVFFFLLFFRYEFIETIFSVKYKESVPIFLMAIMVLPLRAYNFTVVLQNKHRGDLINIGAVIDLIIACVLMYPLYLLMGLPGVALSFVISTYLQGAYYLYHTAKILQVSWLKLVPLTNWLIKLIVFASLFIAIHYVLSQYYTSQIVLFCGILIAMLIAGASLLLEIRATKRIYGARQEKEI